MTALDGLVIGLAMFAGLLLVLVVLDVIARWLLGPDPDLRGPWHPRR
jgi:hypothetical protein